MSSQPVYSETFFSSKIKGLTDAGYDLTVFVNNGKQRIRKTSYKTRQAFPATATPVVQGAYMLVVLMLLFARKPKNTINFIKLERENRHSYMTVLKKTYLNAHILLHHVDILHFGFATTTIGKENVARAVGAKMAVSFRGFDISIYPLKHPGCYNLLWQRVDVIHTISDDLYHEALQLGLSKTTKVKKITPAINVKMFKGAPRNGLNTPLRIVTVARLHWKKGLDYALLALAELKRQNRPFSYEVIGDGPDFERLVFAAHQLHIQDSARFIGKLSHEKTAEKMKSADIYLQPSVQEGFCNAVLEAQASGLLCVVSDAQGLAENVLDGQTGWVVARRDPSALAERIMTIADHPEPERDAVRNNAVSRVERQFTVERQIEAFKTFYEEM